MTEEELHVLAMQTVDEIKVILYEKISITKSTHDYIYIHSFVAQLLLETLIDFLIRISEKESIKLVYDQITANCLQKLSTLH